jgi:hypothetical protein
MSIDYEQLKQFVIQELAVDGPGGSMVPSGPADVPHRMPAAEPPDKEQDMGDPEANELYEMAVLARQATEELIEALDDPIYDGPYEHAFKASACLRRAINGIETLGAHPMPGQRVVAPPKDQQRFGSFNVGQASMSYGDGGVLGAMGEGVDDAGAPIGAGTQGDRAVEMLQKLDSEDEIAAVASWLSAHPQWPVTAKEEGELE